ncbi:MAG TPA: hypothetical protein VMJ64_02940 [Anaerolineales bacterium]|nr:hypothetical protein [Anaerolineales bacterium]
MSEDARANGPESLRVSLGSSEYKLVAGTGTDIPVLLGNPGSLGDYFVVSLLDVPPGWVTYEGAPAIWIEPGGQEKLTMTVYPPADADGVVGSHAARLYVFRQSMPDKGREFRILLRVLPEEKARSNILLRTESTQISAAPGAKVTIPLVISNLSPETEPVELTVQGVPSTWVSLPSPVIALPGGGEKSLDLILQIPPAPEIRTGYVALKISAASQRDRIIKAETQVTLAVAAFESRGRIGVMLGSVQFSVAPGGSLTIPLTILNRGMEPDAFRLGIKGIPVNWVSTTTPVTSLKAGESKEVSVVVRPPVSPSSAAGRQKFRIFVASQAAPDQIVEVDCALTVAAFTQFSAELEPGEVDEGKPVRVIVKNEGNTHQAFQIACISQQDQLAFEFLQPELAAPSAGGPAGPGQGPGAPISQPAAKPTVIPIASGGVAAFRFTAHARKRPLFSGGVAYAYQVTVSAGQKESPPLPGKVNGHGNIPIWLLAIALLIGSYFVCSVSSALLGGRLDAKFGTQTAVVNETLVAPQTVAANQTAAASATIVANQTAAAIEGQSDSDGDGLVNQVEAQMGTDPNVPDTDVDGLMDGQEALKTGTNPLNPDTDADGLKDGDEARLGTNPLSPDTDGDGLPDGAEIAQGTNPMNPDTDGDGLMDGAEHKPCPDPLNPDSDRDGIIDGRDMNVCDANNPSLTSTAIASLPTITPVPPTAIPTQPPPVQPTQPPVQPTQPPVVPTTGLPQFPGMVLFVSDRDGNPEVYAGDSAGHITRMTNNPAADTQPAWDPSLARIVFTTNRDGNGEIYMMNADGTSLANLTNNPADDRDPAWSIYGNGIVFASNRNGNYEIYSLDLRSMKVQDLTNNPASDTQPFWVRSTTGDAGGETILFTSNRDGNNEIYKMKTDGTNPVNLTNNPANDQLAKASLDGKKLAFTSDRNGNQEIYSMGLDGLGLVDLTNNPANDFGSSWSPDNSWLGFTSNRAGNQDVYLTQPGQAQVYKLTNSPGNDQISDWR